MKRPAFPNSSLVIRHADEYVCAPGWSIPPRVHGLNGFFFLRAGQGWVTFDGQRLEARPNDLFITRPWQEMAAGHDPKQPITVLSIGFTLASATRTDVLRDAELPGRLRLTAAQAKRMDKAYRRVIEACRQTRLTDQLIGHGAMCDLAAHVIDLAARLPAARKTMMVTGRQRDDPRVARAMTWIDKHLSEKITLADLAAAAHVSRSHLGALFQQQVGQSPLGYVRARRIAIARQRLADGDASVSQVAAEVGFADPLHFSRVFRREVGMPPSAYAESFRHPFFQ